jgi:hypothetical protein
MNLANQLDASAADSSIRDSTYIEPDGSVFTKHDIFPGEHGTMVAPHGRVSIAPPGHHRIVKKYGSAQIMPCGTLRVFGINYGSRVLEECGWLLNAKWLIGERRHIPMEFPLRLSAPE